MKLLLHIGAEKTGSTSIQRALEKSRPKLRSAGIHLCGTAGHENHKMLAAFAQPFGSRDIALISQGVADDRDAYDAFTARVSERLSREVGASDADTFIITSEDLHRLHDQRGLDALSNLFNPLFDEIELVLFVRRQDRLAVSRYNTLVFHGYQKGFSFEDISEAVIDRFYDFSAILDRWKKSFPDLKVRIVPQGSETPNSENSSVAIFSEIIDFELPEPKRLNRSFNAVDLRLIQIVRNNSDLKAGLDVIKFVKNLKPAGPAPRLPAKPDDARAFMRRFIDTNEALQRNYLNGQPLFSDDFSAYKPDFSPQWIERRVHRRLLKAALN